MNPPPKKRFKDTALRVQEPEKYEFLQPPSPTNPEFLGFRV